MVATMAQHDWNGVLVQKLRTLRSARDLSKLLKNELPYDASQIVDQTHQPISRDMLYCLLQRCPDNQDISTVRRVHSLTISAGLDWIPVFQDQLIRLLASCGSLPDAQQVFCKISKPSVHSWYSIISAHTKLGDGDMALELYHRMQQVGVEPDKLIFLCVLKACSSIGSVYEGRLIHKQIIKIGLESDQIVGNTLVDMYAKCGSLQEAHKMFDRLLNRDVVSWNAMIAGYVQYGYGPLPLELFEKMQKEGIQPCVVTYLCILKACGSIGAIGKGTMIHEQVVRTGLASDVVIGNALVNMYAKCGSMEEAHRVFDGLQNRTIVSWGAVIAGYASIGHGVCALELFNKMQQEGIRPNRVIFSCTLKACCSIGASGQGRLIYEQTVRSALESDVVIGNTLIDMYVKSGSLGEARRVFDSLPNRDRVSWNEMITGYAQHGHSVLALELHDKMQKARFEPCTVLILCILKSCGKIGALGKGKLIHQQIIERGLESDPIIGNALVDMYSKCGTLVEACKVFDKLPARTSVSWGAIIAGHAAYGHGFSAFLLLGNMQQEGRIANNVIYLSLLKACGSIGDLGQGRLMYDQIIRGGLDSDLVIGNTIIDMYVKFGRLEEGRKVFDKLPVRDEVSWGAVIAGYAQVGDGLIALQLFEKMQAEGMQPNRVIFSLALKACGNLGAVEQGRQIHLQIIINGMESDMSVGTTLIDMYANCGRLEEAHTVLDELPNQEAASWNAMIAGYSHHGKCELAVQCLEDMQQQGFKPDSWTFTSILAACSHVGLVEKGYQYFKSMRHKHGVTPTVEHFNCMLDLLGRAGCLSEAEELLQTMPILPNITGWLSLLTSCRTFGNIKLGHQCFAEIIRLDPDSASGYMIMSNIYAEAHMWEDAIKIKELRKCASAWKKPGRVWIEAKKKVQEFVVGDVNHPQCDNVYTKINNLKKQMKEVGYLPQLDLVLEPETCEDTETLAAM